MEIHLLKTQPPEFDAAKDGSKPWEFRKNDRDFKLHDQVILAEYIEYEVSYTGHVLMPRLISWIMYGPRFGLPEGYCIFTLAEMRSSG